MILCLHIGNTHVVGGVFDGQALQFDFRRTSHARISADEFGLFLRGVLLSNEIEPNRIGQVALSSVLPEATYALSSACRKYFDVEPFIVRAGVRTGLKIRYRNPQDVGADRIINAIAAVHQFPDRDLVVAGFGTATTFCAIGADKTFFGGVILPGVRTSLEALVTRAAKLSSVEIAGVDHVIGRSTAESMQSGLYYGQIGMAREIIGRIRTEVFGGQQPLVIGTGEFAGLFESSGLLDVIRPQLMLEGLFLALLLNS
ncbi:type III pantothenate kinase [Breoghania sp.]|uniref:type III pantothenate kinase n=1 Tax=Breoghania sp. TaxID=2065378 RepID=UPI0029C611F6|nr:type III pantothenate kinase [Breoghania sp.]